MAAAKSPLEMGCALPRDRGNRAPTMTVFPLVWMRSSVGSQNVSVAAVHVGTTVSGNKITFASVPSATRWIDWAAAYSAVGLVRPWAIAPKWVLTATQPVGTSGGGAQIALQRDAEAANPGKP